MEKKDRILFSKLFEECKTQLAQEIKAIWLKDQDLWTDDATTLKNHSKRIDELLDRCFTGSNIIVEDMGEWESVESFPDYISPGYWREWHNNKEQASLENEHNIELTQLTGKEYKPFKHQERCWDELLNNNKSICVTSGTGSGKTECFMIPLVKDLAEQYQERHHNGEETKYEPVQAIFLYPLNALMDDQRTRMSECIECSKPDDTGETITFAVYNGNTPQSIDDKERNANAVLDDRRKHEKVFRNDIQSNSHPNIIFTNPTMLEYMLLRQSDNNILKHSQGKLRWIVIDETHTFSGAGAAELALLIRRVVDAFGTDLKDIRFATSSATVGDRNGEEQLKKFISDITGKPEDDIVIVSGKRTLQTVNGHSYTELHDNTYLTLDKTIPGNGDVITKLQQLDTLCEDDSKGLKVKLHFFAKALNRGFYLTLDEYGSAFELQDEIPIDKNSGQYSANAFEARYCCHCGTVFASADLDGNVLSRKKLKTTSIFDNVVDDETDIDGEDSDNENTLKPNTANNIQDILITHRENAIKIAESSSDYSIDKEGTPFDIDSSLTINENDDGHYIYFENTGRCPICGDDRRHHPICYINVATDKLARILAPILLSQTKAEESNSKLPFQGKQMISFADSRAKAAKPSLKQNKENEKKWVSWVVYDKLPKASGTTIDDLRNEFKAQSDEVAKVIGNQQAYEEANKKLKEIQEILEIAQNKRITWSQAIDALLKDDHFDYFAKQFASKNDLENDGSCKTEYKHKYVLAALYETFKYRMRKISDSENQGQIKVVYPLIEKFTEDDITKEIRDLFQAANINDGSKILQGWKELLTIYMDFKVRVNQSVFFRDTTSGWAEIDINACRNLRTKNGERRPANRLLNNKRFQDLLSKLLGEDDFKHLDAKKKDLVNNAVKACWEKLKEIRLLENGSYRKDDEWVEDAPFTPERLLDNTEYNPAKDQARLNLTNIAFTLPEQVWLCPVTNRYLSTTFMGYSPYSNAKKGYGVKVGEPTQAQTMEKPQLFIQSEHTAQLGRVQTKSRIKDFKEHKINILSCSTTMEMGVDLGSVEMVEMTNIPPHPANYKQRAGRAGRRGQNSSVCFTICGSDGIDANFFNNSLKNVTKKIDPPTVDLQSTQVVQRHINSFLLKQWLLKEDTTISLGGNSETKMIDFFTVYSWGGNGDKTDYTTVMNRQNLIRPIIVAEAIHTANNKNLSAGSEYLSEDNYASNYYRFYNYLQTFNPSQSDKDTADKLCKLIKGTACESKSISDLVNQTKNDIKKIWDELDAYFNTLKENGIKRCFYYRKGLDVDRTYCKDNHCPHLDRCQGYETNFDHDYSTTTKAKLQEGLKKCIMALNYDFTSKLSESLLTHLSNHQFLPNANMPVNIVELKLSDTHEKYSKNNENPTYDLATALGQWAPGNYITIKDTTYQIGGIQHDYTKSWTKIKKCENCGHTWISQEATCPICHSSNLKKWDVNGKKELTLIEPIAFIPTTDRSRITEDNQNYTRAKAELIGASKMISPSKGWFAHRISDSNNTTSQILIYNDGMKFGYKICKRCGKAELETSVAQQINEVESARDFYKKVPIKRQDLLYHDDVPGQKEPCFFNIQNDTLSDKVYRNIIIGGLIQTDFCEISFYKQGNNLGIEPMDDESILTTLGVLFCSFLVDIGICERKDIDFIITGKNCLCIYDKAKGGAGYSKQLDQVTIANALDYCRNTLTNCKSLYSILDSFTQRHAENININSTLSWLDEEHKHRNDVPKKIKDVFGENVKTASFIEIQDSLRK